MNYARRDFCKSLSRLATGLFVPSAFAILHGLETEADAQPLTLNDLANSGNQSSAGATCSDGGVTSAWAAQVVTNGGTAIPTATQTAHCNLVSGLKSDGVWNNLVTLNTFDPTSLIGAYTPSLVVPSVGVTPWTNAVGGSPAFVSGDLTANGLKGDGSSKYFSPTAGSAISDSTTSGMFVYISAMDSVSCPIHMGGTDGTGADSFLLSADCSGSFFWDAYNSTVARLTGTASGLAGYYCGTRIGAADSELFFANSTHAHASLGTNTGAGGPWHTTQVYVFAFASGGVTQLSNARMSCAGITKNNLTAAQSASLFSRIQTFLQARGGGFV